MARLHNGINKRLFKELNEITDTPQVAAYYLNNKVNREKGDVEMHFVIFPYEKKICRLTLKIPSCWPFRPPSCYITNNLHEKIGDYIESIGSIPLKDNKCCCCSSLLCSNNWHCQCKLLDFMLEFQKNYTNSIVSPSSRRTNAFFQFLVRPKSARRSRFFLPR